MAKKSAGKSAAPGKPFTGKDDPRNGHGPEKGAPNAGRPPSWIKALAAEILKRDELIEVLGAIARADLGEEWKNDKGEPIYSETQNKDRIAAIKVLLAYGDGLPIARQELTGADGGPIETQANADSPLERISRKLSGIAARQATAGDANRIQRGTT